MKLTAVWQKYFVRSFFGVLLWSMLSGVTVAAQETPFEKIYRSEYPVFAYPNGASGFFLPDERPAIKVVVKNNASPSATFKIECILQNSDQQVLEKKSVGSFSLKEAAQKVISVDFAPLPKLGYYVVKIKVWAGNKLACETSTALVIAPEQPVVRDPFFGVINVPDDLLDGYRRVGIGSVNHYVVTRHYVSGYFPRPWFRQERGDKWQDWMDYQIGLSKKVFAATDFKIVGMMQPHVELNAAMKKRVAEGLFPFTDDQVIFFRTVAERASRLLKNRIKFWVVQEEIDASYRANPPLGGTGLGTLCGHMLATRKIYEGIKRGNPQAKVAVLGINGDDYFINQPAFLVSKMILKDLDGYFDFLCIDAYSGAHSTVYSTHLGAPERGPRNNGRGLRRFLTDSAELSASFGRPRAVINAERGYGTLYFGAFDSPDSREAARLLARSLIIARSTPTLVYLQFYGSATSFPEGLKRGSIKYGQKFGDYGLWKSIYNEKGKFTFIPRQMSLAHATVARELAFSKFICEVRPTDEIYTYVFRHRDGSQLAAVWTIGDHPIKSAYTLPAGEVIDLAGNVQKFRAGLVTLTLTGEPQFIKISHDSTDLAKIMKQVVFPGLTPLKGAALRSGMQELSLFLVNQTAQSQHGEVWNADKKIMAVNLAPRKPWKGKIPYAEKVTIKLANGAKIDLPVEKQFLNIPRQRDPRQGLVQKLPFPQAIRPGSVLIPELALFKFDGNDVNAKLYWSWDEKYLHLGCDVQDKVHQQRHILGNIWMDDCLQFALSTNFDYLPGATAKQYPDNQLSSSDHNFGLALTKQGVQLYQFNGSAGLRSYPAQVERHGSLTRYTVAIPWKALGITPQPGVALRAAAVIFDNNRVTDRCALYWLTWGEGLAGGQNRSKFKTLILQ